MRKYDLIYCASAGPDVGHPDHIDIGLLADLLGYNADAVTIMLQKNAGACPVASPSAGPPFVTSTNRCEDLTVSPI